MFMCPKCKQEKTIEEFKKGKSSKTGIGSWCKKCHSKQTTEATKKDRTKANTNNKKYSETEKGKLSKKRYKQSEVGKLAKKRYTRGESGRAASIRHRCTRRQLDKTVSNTLTAKELEEILESQNNTCNICKCTFGSSDIKTRAERDYIKPLSKGGALTKENVQALCRSCNSRKGNKEIIK